MPFQSTGNLLKIACCSSILYLCLCCDAPLPLRFYIGQPPFGLYPLNGCCTLCTLSTLDHSGGVLVPESSASSVSPALVPMPTVRTTKYVGMTASPQSPKFTPRAAINCKQRLDRENTYQRRKSSYRCVGRTDAGCNSSSGGLDSTDSRGQTNNLRWSPGHVSC